MIVEYIRYNLKQKTVSSLIDAYRRAGEYLEKTPECLGYELSVCEEVPSSVILRILWDSREAHLEGFRKGPNFSPFLAIVGPFFGEIEEMRHYSPTGLAWSRQ
ncbi:putative quinol monooxygenase [Inquilinus sp. OTU3971]|uniref:putative quinol monooxygenase n=1 Tax=Inquilinus sp. OTU3971 TaxID=3043855 RepID=UPI00406D31D8